MKRLSRLVDRWVNLAPLSKAGLGKYIILGASFLHITWAALLVLASGTAGSTPVNIIVRVAGGPYRAAFVLLVVASLALTFPFLGRRVTNELMAALLIPQQVVLFMSAGAGLYAAVVQHYADGVIRPLGFILSDQLPVIVLALLYTAVIIESAFAPPRKEGE